VLLASASGAIVIAFGVRPDRKALDLAQQEHVDIRTHTIIYEVSDELKKAMEGLLEPVVTETYLGRAEVRTPSESRERAQWRAATWSMGS